MSAFPELDLPAPAAETDVLWFLPTHGDGRYLATEVAARHVTHRYLAQVARAADELGYFGVLLPTGQSCEDSWVVASSLVPMTERLRFLVAVRPGLQEPSVAARMTATLDRVSDGRLLINVVTGGDPVEARGDGIFLPHDARYAVTDEFLTIYRRLLGLETVSFEGEHLRVENGRLLFPPVQRPHPPLYFGGSSEAGMRVAGEHVDTYLTWGEPPADVAKKIADAKRAGGRDRAAFLAANQPVAASASPSGVGLGRAPVPAVDRGSVSSGLSCGPAGCWSGVAPVAGAASRPSISACPALSKARPSSLGFVAMVVPPRIPEWRGVNPTPPGRIGSHPRGPGPRSRIPPWPSSLPRRTLGRQIGDDVGALLRVGEPGEVHGRAGREGGRVRQPDIEAGFGPGPSGVPQGLRVAVARPAPRHARVDDAEEIGAVHVGTAAPDRVAGRACPEHLPAAGRIGGPGEAGGVCRSHRRGAGNRTVGFWRPQGQRHRAGRGQQTGARSHRDRHPPHPARPRAAAGPGPDSPARIGDGVGAAAGPAPGPRRDAAGRTRLAYRPS